MMALDERPLNGLLDLEAQGVPDGQVQSSIHDAERLGGELRIRSAPEGGTEVDVRIHAASAYVETSSGLLRRWMKRLKAARPG